MEWYIDGYNVLFRHGLGHNQEAREWLSRKTEAHFLGKKIKVTIVYDSRESSGRQQRKLSKGLREIFVGNADRYLIQEILDSKNPREITLVTSDYKDIISAVKSRRPQIVDSTSFLRLISQKAPRNQRGPEKPAWETEENIERYLKLFQDEEEK